MNRQKFRILFVIILILVCIINLAGLSFGTDNRQGSFDGFFFLAQQNRSNSPLFCGR